MALLGVCRGNAAEARVCKQWSLISLLAVESRVLTFYLLFLRVLLWPSVVGGLHDVIPSPWRAEVRMPTERTQRLHVC